VEKLSSAVRLDLRPGEWVLWKARPFRFVSLQGSTASIRDSVNAELHEGGSGGFARHAIASTRRS